ncbi:MAG: histidine phosphatase family protein [Maricaulis sp.]|nr:histidine phosphatase family protein [Maricaulis sp.]HAQ33960.1 histidine phosphatase family protein [Alphaproteobacteria bacterium]
MTRLILARHGNTFGPGDKIVWVGAKEDLPLVDKGEAQARDLGKALVRAGVKPDRIVTGPLRRTRRAADLVAEFTGFSGAIEIDARLKEIDYGPWGGKSDDEIIAAYGEAALADWRDRHVVPAGAGWSPSPGTLKANALAVLSDVSRTSGTVLIVTSNGILRFFHAAMGFDGDAKVKTGHAGAADMAAGQTTPLFWNLDPAKGLPL